MSYLPEKKRNLTEKQQSFLDNLVETRGDFKKSAELAGYQGNHYQILKTGLMNRLQMNLQYLLSWYQKLRVSR